ncbi:DUF1217 domain-containing protein [Pleomorphomonas sp. JP5]|uniref:DUF1217 domain-containing protein n=1 Tax=Pleomorphomonas sp. JP5 TaxID=2942998 RepID=UPI0020439AFB|nr:DUF1217 domain-containing protein [Pleomorphomonas sp. JP5]MCM5556384.1 DUF1217 domain-containing protein [Pleomorphomonas sp. JP5]
MLSTPLSYQMITRDMTATLTRTSAQPDVKRATEYYRENIGKVSSLEEFFDDHRLYSYAMKAYGLEDMTYAKAFMRKVLESDLSDSKSFANKLVDKRYQEFAKAFSFLKSSAQSPDALSDIKTRYAEKAAEQGDTETLIKFGTMAYEQTLPNVKTVDDFLADDSLVGYAMTAFGVEPPGTAASAKTFLRRILTSDPNDTDSYAARQTNSAWRELAAAFNFSADGTIRVQTSEQAETTISSYLRQTIEAQAGKENEGVRLALYFERKAPTITSAYSILADPALLKVAQTVLGLSTQTGNADIDVQAKYFESRIDIESLSKPEELKKFLTRFTAMWEAANPSSTATTSVAALITGQSNAVMSADTLMSLQGLKLGGL